MVPGVSGVRDRGDVRRGDRAAGRGRPRPGPGDRQARRGRQRHRQRHDRPEGRVERCRRLPRPRGPRLRRRELLRPPRRRGRRGRGVPGRPTRCAAPAPSCAPRRTGTWTCFATHEQELGGPTRPLLPGLLDARGTGRTPRSGRGPGARGREVPGGAGDGRAAARSTSWPLGPVTAGRRTAPRSTCATAAPRTRSPPSTRWPAEGTTSRWRRTSTVTGRRSTTAPPTT